MVLVFVPSFKAFLILYFVAMLCTSIRDWGNACTAEAQGRWVKVLQKSFLPAGFQMCRSPLSEGVPAPLSAGSWMETSPGDLSKGQRPGCPSPECGCHPRALIPMAQEELLRRGMSSHDPSGLSHWALPAKSFCIFAPSLVGALGQGRARLAALQDSAQVLSKMRTNLKGGHN